MNGLKEKNVFEMKTCVICGVSMPKTNDNFRKSQKSEDGFQVQCLSCTENPEVKACTLCGAVKPRTIEYFRKSTKNKDGLQSECKCCLIKRNKKYNKLIKEDGRARQYYEENRLSFILNQLKQRGCPSLTLEDLTKIMENFKIENGSNVCPYCNREITDIESLHWDHFVAYCRGGDEIITNIIPVCKYCNRSKSGEDFSEWYKKQFFYNPLSHSKIIKYVQSEVVAPYFKSNHIPTKLNY